MQRDTNRKLSRAVALTARVVCAASAVALMVMMSAPAAGAAAGQAERTWSFDYTEQVRTLHVAHSFLEHGMVEPQHYETNREAPDFEPWDDTIVHSSWPNCARAHQHSELLPTHLWAEGYAEGRGEQWPGGHWYGFGTSVCDVVFTVEAPMTVIFSGFLALTPDDQFAVWTDVLFEHIGGTTSWEAHLVAWDPGPDELEFVERIGLLGGESYRLRVSADVEAWFDPLHSATYEVHMTRAGDVNLDGAVDVLDLLELIAVWGACADPICLADINRDGMVDVLDLLELLANWG